MLPDLSPGTYLCVRTHGFTPWLIRRATRSDYDHVFLYTGHGRIIEAEPAGCTEALLTKYVGYQVAIDLDTTLTPQQRERIVAKATALLGVPYGFLDIARLGLAVLGVRWSWLTARADNEKAMICSQLVAACGQAAGVDWLCGQPAAAQVTPGMLAARPTVQRGCRIGGDDGATG